MLRAKIVLMSLCVLVLAGCGQHSVVSRNATTLSLATAGATPDQQMLEQAQALDAMTKDMMRRATIKGAAIGAAAGCSLALVSAAESTKCLAGAVAGGAVGAVVGNAMGKAEVEKRIELVSLNRVTPAISGAQKQMALMNDSMAGLISAQDDELAVLKMQHNEGHMSPAEYAQRLAEIRATRAEVAEALTLSAEQAHTTREALKTAKAQGQQGLDWHILQVETLEEDAVSARARISLL